MQDLDTKLSDEAQKLGALGAIFGARENAALYVSSIILIIVLVLLGTLMFIDENLRSDLATAIGGIGVAAIGFIGGLLRK